MLHDEQISKIVIYGYGQAILTRTYQSFKENVHFPHNAVEMAQPGKALDC